MLSIAEVKERLGWGAVTDIAFHFGYKKGHVSQVLNGKRPDRKIARHVAMRLKVRIADLPQEYVGQSAEAASEAAVVGG